MKGLKCNSLCCYFWRSPEKSKNSNTICTPGTHSQFSTISIQRPLLAVWNNHNNLQTGQPRGITKIDRSHVALKYLKTFIFFAWMLYSYCCYILAGIETYGRSPAPVALGRKSNLPDQKPIFRISLAVQSYTLSPISRLLCWCCRRFLFKRLIKWVVYEGVLLGFILIHK